MTDQPLDLHAVDTALRQLFGVRWGATGMLDGVVVVAVVDPAPADVGAVQQVLTGAGLLGVPRGRADLETLMDAIEAQLVRGGELDQFLQMSPDGFSGAVDLVVEREVPVLRAWASTAVPAGALRIVVDAPTPSHGD